MLQNSLAKTFNGKNVEQIRDTFKIKNDFTPDEEEQNRKEYACHDSPAVEEEKRKKKKKKKQHSKENEKKWVNHTENEKIGDFDYSDFPNLLFMCVSSSVFVLQTKPTNDFTVVQDVVYAMDQPLNCNTLKNK